MTLGTIHIWRPLKLSNFQDPPALVHLRPIFFHLLDLGCPILNKPLTPLTNYQTTTSPCMWTNEIKTKTKASHVTFKLTTRSIIKVWLHSLTPESIGRVLVNNKLMFDSTWCLVMAHIQFSLIKKKLRLEVQNTCYPLHPPTSGNISFLPYSPPPRHTHPFKEDAICVSPLITFDFQHFLT